MSYAVRKKEIQAKEKLINLLEKLGRGGAPEFRKSAAKFKKILKKEYRQNKRDLQNKLIK